MIRASVFVPYPLPRPCWHWCWPIICCANAPVDYSGDDAIGSGTTNNITGINLFQLKCAVVLAAALMLLPLRMQYIGEEPFFAISTYEMLFSGGWTHATLYGRDIGRLPVFQWVAALFAEGVGTQHMAMAIRLVSVTATWITAFVAGNFAQRLFHSEATAWLAALVFLTLGETMFWYGWLGYSDALFSCFVFCSIVLLWHALETKNSVCYVFAWIALGIAVMVKALTAYVFFGVAVLVLTTGFHRWPFVLRPAMLLGALFGASIPWAIAYLFGDFSGFFNVMIVDVTKHHGGSWMATIRHVLYFPFVSFARVLPLSLLIALLAWKNKGLPLDKNVRLLLWIVGLNYLPYWLNSTASPRYIIPLYPPVAILFAFWLAHADSGIKRWATYLVMTVIIVKIPFSLWALPYAKGGWRADHNMPAIAASIIRHAGNKPILSENDAASGMGVVAYIDQRLFPERVVLSPSSTRGDAYILTYFPKPGYGHPVQRYTMHGDAMYLYHRK